MMKPLNRIKGYILVLLTILLCASVSLVLTACSREKIADNIGDIVEEIKEITENNESDVFQFDMPYMYIETQNNKLPTNKVDYVNCSFAIKNTDNVDDSFFVSMKDNYGDKDSVGIRLRGNSTMGLDKKPYRIKFDKKQSFFGSPKNKNWVLLADYLDPSDMRNYTALSLAEKFENLDFTPSHHHVILYLNGEYKGVYLLTDHIDEKAGRTDVEEDFDVDVDTDFPFLVEMSHDANSGIEGVDYFTINGFEPIEIKYPEADERGVGDTVYQYIHDYMEAVLTLLKNGNCAIDVAFRSDPVVLSDLIDEDSLIDFMLVNEIMGNGDSTWKSIKLHKNKNGKLKFGPVWDFDSCAIPQWTGTPDQTQYDLSIAETTITFGGNLPKCWLAISGNQTRLYDRFMEKRDCIIEVVDSLFDYYEYIAPAVREDANLWYGENGVAKFEEQYNFLERFLIVRYKALPNLLKP